MRTVVVVTVGRSDYGICRPILQRIRSDTRLRARLLVSGGHLSPEFGSTTACEIEADGFDIADRVEMLLSSDSPEGIAKSIGLGIIGFSACYARARPDVVLVVGDRFEMYSAAVAALPFAIPVAHVHGGELTEGAFDDALRHSITKLSHLHFVSTDAYRERVIQLGEEPWRVTVTGAPSLANVRSMELLSPAELAKLYDLPLERPLLVTFHPVTLEYEEAEAQVNQLLKALSAYDIPIVFSRPNADTNGRVVYRRIQEFVATRRTARLVENFGTQSYFSFMAWAAAMVGNSSSGIIEAPSFGLPVVNVGSRQDGRVRGPNVIDVGYDHEEIAGAISRTLRPEFRASLRGSTNPYGDGTAAEQIVATLSRVELGERLLRKRFWDIARGTD